MRLLKMSQAFITMTEAYGWAKKQTQCHDKGSSMYLRWLDKPEGWFVYRSEVRTDTTEKNILPSKNKSSKRLSIIESWAMVGDVEPLIEKHISLDKARNMLAAGINSRYTSKYKEKI